MGCCFIEEGTVAGHSPRQTPNPRHRQFATNVLLFIPRYQFALLSSRPAEKFSNDVSGHLLAKRRALGALQADIAGISGVSTWAYRDWEQGAQVPAIDLWPAIIEFLGNDPQLLPSTLVGRIPAWRWAHGKPCSVFSP